MTKIIVADSRSYHNYNFIEQELNTRLIMGDEIVSGCASGVDTCAINYANTHGLTCHKFPADWNKYGKSAGPIHNTEIAQFADGLIAFYSGTPGTAHMIRTMASLNKQMVIIDV